MLDKTRRDLEQAQRREDRLYDLYEKEAISVEEFRERFAPFEEKKRQLVESITRLQAEIAIISAETVTKADILREGESLLKEWPNFDNDRKREVVESLVESITIHKDRRVEFALHYVPGQSLVNSQPQQFFA